MRHPYSVHGGENTVPTWTIILAFLSLGVAWASNHLLEGLNRILNLTTNYEAWRTYIPSISVVFVFGLLYKWLDKRAWRFRILRRLGVVNNPNLSGTYAIDIMPRNGINGKRLAGILKIDQTWTQISISLVTEISASHSTSAAIQFLSPSLIELRNQYRAMRKPGAPNDMEMHEGSNYFQFEVTRGGVRLSSGTYYTDGTRQTHGDILSST
jgi:hypothetical protein